MTMHDALTAHPKFQAFEQRLADAEAMAEAAAEHDRTIAAAYQEALASMKPGDPYPAAPEATAGSGWIYGQRATIRGERGEWLSQNFDELAERFAKTEDELLAKAAKVIAQVDALTDELDELSSTANFLTMTARRPAMIRHGAGNDTLANLIAAVRTGRFLFREPYAVGGPRTPSQTTIANTATAYTQ